MTVKELLKQASATGYKIYSINHMVCMGFTDRTLAKEVKQVNYDPKYKWVYVTTK